MPSLFMVRRSPLRVAFVLPAPFHLNAIESVFRV